ncbi:MAG TPA: hypothetical protein VFH68_21540 [Polyangia bacterium]|nr:hypothetical protein [Polyangia bacterium]
MRTRQSLYAELPILLKSRGARPRLCAGGRALGLSLTLLFGLLSLSAASCGGTRACKDGTLFVAVSLDPSAAMADKLVVSVSVGEGTATTTRLDHPSGQSAGSVEIDFPKGYPGGERVTVAVSATRADAPVGSGSASATLGGGCAALSISVSGSGGGSGGGSGSGGQTGSGGTTVTNDGGLDVTGSGGGDGGSAVGGAGAGGSLGIGGFGVGGFIGGGLGGFIVGGLGGTGVGGRTGVGGMSGFGGMTGLGGVTGTGGITVGCPVGQSLCAGICYATATDRAHCGPSCSACSAAEVCASTCVAAAAPAFTRVPPDPAGWQDPSGAALLITVRSTGYTNAIYECRTGPDASFTAAFPAWATCDGTTAGTGLNHTPTPNPTTPEGNYRTEHRYRADTYLSPVIAIRYYVHHNLDKVAFCPSAALPNDGPHFTDAAYFMAAQDFATSFPAAYPVSGTFPAPSAIPVRSDAIYLRNPFINIPFTAVAETIGMYSTPPVGSLEAWPSPGRNYTFNERSLRHAWVMNPGRTMILLKRRYVSPKNSCLQQFRGGHIALSANPRHSFTCEALVLNTRGNGLCFNALGTSIVQVANEPALQAPGTVAVTLGSTTITGTGTRFSGTVGQFIQIPSFTGRWYQIATASSNTTLTISTPYPNASASGLTHRIDNVVIPAAFAKMHSDAHNYATGVTAPKTPSPRTKCETLGCNAGKPWLTYLPP